MNLITDRSKDHVDYLKKLNAKGWTRMNPTEKAEWSGNPLLSQYLLDNASPVNLFSGSYYSGSAAWVKTDGEVFTITPPQPNLSQTVMRFSLGDADYLIGQTVTLSFGSVTWEGDITPVLSFRWSDSNTNIAKLDLTQSNSITFDCPIIVSYGVKLYAFLYFTSGAAVAPDDAVVILNRIMFEFGSVAHDYVPYQSVLNTYARRGAYNYTDLNRVEAAAAEIAGLLGLTLTTKTDWGVWDIPTVTEMARYLSNVVAIRDAALALYPSVVFPTLPESMDNLTWELANNIEETLRLAYALVVGGTLTWDGVTAGLDILHSSPYSYKVSDAVITADDVTNGVNMWLYRTDTKVEAEVDVVTATPTSGALVIMHEASGNYVISVDEIGASKYGAPSAGTYFAKSTYVYVSKLVIPGYTGFFKEE